MTEFHTKHNQQWGNLYRVEDVQIDWHVPSEAEISLAMVGTLWLELQKQLIHHLPSKYWMRSFSLRWAL